MYKNRRGDDLHRQETEISLDLPLDYLNLSVIFSIHNLSFKRTRRSFIEFIRHNHKMFCAKWGIDYPLHYNAIRSRNGNYTWLGKDINSTNRNPEAFVQEYHDFMAAQPYRVVGSCIHKTEDMYKLGDPLGKKFETIRLYAFERTIFYLLRSLFQNEEVSIHIEKSGKNEDNQLINYLESFKNIGVTAIDGKLSRVEKTNPFTQIADFCAYVIAKASKEENYRPYVMLKNAGKL